MSFAPPWGAHALSQAARPYSGVDELKEIYEERAAILEHEAGWPRAVAESEARRLVTHLRWLRGERQAQWIEPPDVDTVRPGTGGASGLAPSGD